MKGPPQRSDRAPPAPAVDVKPLVVELAARQLNWFKERGVFPLKQLNLRFPRAFLHCRLCSFHMSSLSEGIFEEKKLLHGSVVVRCSSVQSKNHRFENNVATEPEEC